MGKVIDFADRSAFFCTLLIDESSIELLCKNTQKLNAIVTIVSGFFLEPHPDCQNNNSIITPSKYLLNACQKDFIA